MYKGPEIRVSAWTYLMMALWLLVLPLRLVLSAWIAACIHELGHLTVLWLWDIRVHRLEINGFGAKIETSPMSAEEELCCALAGPAAGMILWLFHGCFPVIGVCALAQSAFNLIPVYPLDGGRALRAMRKICCKDEQMGL